LEQEIRRLLFSFIPLLRIGLNGKNIGKKKGNPNPQHIFSSLFSFFFFFFLSLFG